MIRRGYLILALPLIAVILYNNSLFIFLDAIPRYTIPIAPFYILFAVVGFSKKDVFIKETEVLKDEE